MGGRVAKVVTSRTPLTWIRIPISASGVMVSRYLLMVTCFTGQDFHI